MHFGRIMRFSLVWPWRIINTFYYCILTANAKDAFSPHHSDSGDSDLPAWLCYIQQPLPSMEHSYHLEPCRLAMSTENATCHFSIMPGTAEHLTRCSCRFRQSIARPPHLYKFPLVASVIPSFC